MFSKRKKDKTQLLGESQMNVVKQEDVLAKKTTNPDSGFRTTKPLGFKFFIAGAALLVILLIVGLFSIFYNRTYKIGSQTFSKKDITATTAALNKVPQVDQKSVKKASEDRVVLLAALKSEADARKVPYDSNTLDQYLAQTIYASKGGKQAYMDFMKRTYGWSEKDVYQTQTVDYLKGKLQKELLADKVFTSVYIRWDVLKEAEKDNYTASLGSRRQLLEAKYKPLLESKTSPADIAKQVDLVRSLGNQKDTQEAFRRTNGTPVIMLTEKPGDISYKSYPKADGQSTTDPQSFFAKFSKSDQTFGAEMLSDGRLIIARLDQSTDGKYANWDDFLGAAKRKSGLGSSKGKQTSLQRVTHHIADLLIKANVFRPQPAYAGSVSCAGHQIPVHFSFKAEDINTHAPLTAGSFAAQATRDMSVCDEQEYIDGGYTVSGNYPKKTVQKTIWGVPGSVDLDCVGYDWAFWAPSIANYSYRDTTSTGAYENGGSIDIVFRYESTASNNTVSCSLDVLAGTAVDLRKIKLTASGNTSGLTAKLTSSVSGGEQSMSLPSSTSGDVKPASSGTSTYTVTIKDSSGKQITTCSTTVNTGSSSVSCSISIAGATASYQDPYTASWSVSNAPAGSKLFLYGSGSGQTTDVTGRSSQTVGPKVPPSGGSATTSYTLTVKSNGATIATCGANITIGKGGQCQVCNCGGYCDYGYIVTGFECPVDAWIADLSKPDKKGEKLEVVPYSKPIQVKPGQKYYVETKIQKITTTIHTDAAGTYLYETSTNEDFTDIIGKDYYLSDGISQTIGLAGGIIQPDYSSSFKVTLQPGHSPYTGGNNSGEGKPDDGAQCLRAEVPDSPCVIGSKGIDVLFPGYRNAGLGNPTDRGSLFSNTRFAPHLLKQMLVPLDRFFGFVPYSYIAPFEYGTPSSRSVSYEKLGRGGAPGGGILYNEGVYTGKVLTWTYDSTDKLAPGEVAVSIVFKNGQAEPFYKGMPLPTKYFGPGANTNSPPSTMGSALPVPADAFESDYAWVTNGLGGFSGQLDYPKDRWFDMAIPIEGDATQYTVKIYKMNVNNMSKTDNFQSRFNNLSGSDGIPEDSAKITECGSKPPVVEKPSNKPYLKIDGADVVSGAAFMSQDSSHVCSITDRAKNATIKTNGFFDNKETWGFSGSQYATFASGVIGGGGANTFLGNDGNLRDGYRDLLFANNSSKSASKAGVYYSGLAGGIPCISLDIAALKAKSTYSGQLSQTSVDAVLPNGAGIMVANPNTNIVINGVDSLSNQKTLIVDGNVTINGNITYQDPASPDKMPYLKIIAKNIYIKNDVTRVDANLVAYPKIIDASTNSLIDGKIDTCVKQGETGGIWPSEMTMDTCKTKLQINGSVTARHILWKRTYGSVGDASNVVDPSCLYGSGVNSDFGSKGTTCAAEYIRFSPESYLAGFNNPSQALGAAVSTVELPPIY